MKKKMTGERQRDTVLDLPRGRRHLSLGQDRTRRNGQVGWLVIKFAGEGPKLKVGVIGDALLDVYVDGDVERLSPEDPTCFVLKQTHVTYQPGGAANAALNVAALGARAKLICVTGDDIILNMALTTEIDGLSGKLELADLPYAKSSRRHLKTRFCCNGRQLLRVDNEETAPIQLTDTIEQALAKAIENLDIVILSDYAKGLLSPPILSWLRYHLAAMKIPYVVDPKRSDLNAYGRALAICPNQREWEAADNAHLECKHIVVTQSSEGCNIIHQPNVTQRQKRYTHVHVEPVEVCDPSGAGDTFVAALTIALGTGYPIKEACELANSAARIAVTKRGTASVSLEELHRLVMEKAPV